MSFSINKNITKIEIAMCNSYTNIGKGLNVSNIINNINAINIKNLITKYYNL